MGRTKPLKVVSGELNYTPPAKTKVESSHRTAKGRVMHDIYYANLDNTAPDPDTPDLSNIVLTGQASNIWEEDFQFVDNQMEMNPPETETVYHHDMTFANDPTKPQNPRIVELWAKDQEVYLDQLLRLEGLESSQCSLCAETPVSIYRCRDCHGMPLFGQKCLITSHQPHPLHRVEIWTGKYWKRIFMSDPTIGLTIHLGHGGSQCPNHVPIPASAVLHVFHLNGYHPVRFAYCGCAKPLHPLTHQDRRYQLFRNTWFPASQKDPGTVFTFDILKFYNKLGSQGRASMKDYYDALVLFTDASGITDVPKRYDEFLAICRCYGHLQMMKRGGVGHSPSGVASIGNGDLALDCSMCPHPGKNLPDNYQEIEPAKRYKNALHIATDGCFKLKGKDQRGKGIVDRPLAPGSAYFVNDTDYAAEISQEVHAKYGQIPSTCDSTHRAFDQAETKFNKGYSVTGVVGTVCSRHGLARSNGVGDLQKGERYVNVDYVLLATLRLTLVSMIVASYDIACQYGVNFDERMTAFPEDMQLNLILITLFFVVPKLHLMVHGPKCQGPFSLNFLFGAGRTDGEGVDRFWSLSGPAAPRTREMTPGHRKDHLNNFWGHLNWAKLRNASEQVVKQRESFALYTASLPEEEVAEWDAEYLLWEADRFGRPNPFARPLTSTSYTAKLDELIQMDEDRLANANTPLDKGSLTTPQFVATAIELEAEVIKLRKEEADDVKSAGLITVEHKKKRKTLMGKMGKWLAIQPQFMPQLPAYLLNIPAHSPLRSIADDPLTLWLPSKLPFDIRDKICSTLLTETEITLRIALADSSLDDMRKWLHHQQHGYQFKRKHISGQHPSTRAYARFDKIKKKTSRAAACYRRSRAALVALHVNLDDPNSDLSRFQVLKEEDIRGLFDEEAEVDKSKKLTLKDARNLVGQGQKVQSWIWLMQRAKGSDQDMDVSSDLCVEWFRSKARLARWEEEVIIVEEEMCRTLQYHVWQAATWRARGNAKSDVDVMAATALAAYAEKQAIVWESLGITFADLWWDDAKRHGLERNWPTLYLPDRALMSLDLMVQS